jgi:hypothetical protein
MKNRHITQLLAVTSALLIVGGLNVSAVTLGEALDNTNLVWTTPVDGDVVWIATNNNFPTFDGVDVAAPATVGHDQKSVLETTVTGPGLLSFWWSVESEEDFDYFLFFVDPEVEIAERDNISGEVGWQFRSYEIASGLHTLRWVFERDFAGGGGANKGFLDQVKFTTGSEIPLGTALNTTFATWTSDGNSNPTYWTGQTNFSRVDGVAAESGAITTGQTSSMETTVIGVTNVSFWWMVSSVTNQGSLRFYTNGVQLFQISGEVGWQNKTNIVLNGGTNTLRWSCETTPIAIGKLNRGWVDEVVFSPALAPSAPLVLGTPTLTNGVVQFDVNFQAGAPFRILYSTNLADGLWSELLSTNSSSAVTTVTDPGATYSPSGRFYRAVYP